MCRGSIVCVVLLIGLAGAAGQGGGKNSGQPVKVEQAWSGRMVGKEKEDLKKLAPEKGYIAGPKAFAALWKAWRTDEKVPEIDFAKKLVVVGLAGGPNEVTLIPFVDAQGNLTPKMFATLVGGPGFGYALGVVDRDGIKSVQGKPLEKDE
jgi:hypothetical protein